MREVVAEARRLQLERGVDVVSVVTREAAARDPARAAQLASARAELRAYLANRPAEVERELAGEPAAPPRPPDPAACEVLEAGGARFSLCGAPLPYAEAQALCAARGEELAWLDDAAQAAALHEAARTRRAGRRTHDRWWLGLDDRAAEGTFRWRGTGAAAALTAWDRGEPDNAGCNQDCTVLDTADGRWRDTHCLEAPPVRVPGARAAPSLSGPGPAWPSLARGREGSDPHVAHHRAAPGVARLDRAPRGRVDPHLGGDVGVGDGDPRTAAEEPAALGAEPGVLGRRGQQVARGAP